MKTRLIVFGVGALVVLVAVYFIFATLPSKDSTTPVAPPTINPGEKLSGETLEGQLLFSRGGMLWAWHGNSANRLAIEPGNSLVANYRVALTQPALAPASDAIAYIRQDESFSDLWVINADGTNPRQLTRDQGPGPARSEQFVNGSLWAFNPAWSPDGNSIAYLTDKGTDDLTLWVSSASNFNPRRVATLGVGQGGISRPSWSPDGTRIIVAAFENGKPQIFRVNVQNGNTLQLTSTPEGAYDPIYSPDGKYIAYVANKGNGTELWLMDSEGENPVQLSPLSSRYPAWSPSGDKIAFLSTKDGSFDIFTIAINAGAPGEVKQITSKANIDSNGGLSWGK